jgi:hypothetical protein
MAVKGLIVGEGGEYFMPNGANHPQWKGGRIVDKSGYVLIHNPSHPEANSQGYVREHILIAEKALGKPLPLNSQVHHFNLNEGDNSKGNHVICQDDAYHKLLHQRTRAFNACGHGSWRKCWICKEYDSPEKLTIRGARVYHQFCQSEYNKIWRNKNPDYSRKYRKEKRNKEVYLNAN